jgi:hypothetical protein
MEQHRQRIEEEHNEGVPRREWERMEQIVDGMIQQGATLKEVADCYEVTHGELIAWQRKRGQSGASRIKAQIRLSGIRPHNRLTRQAIQMRMRRGMSEIDAMSRPPMTPSQRASRAAMSRWGATQW